MKLFLFMRTTNIRRAGDSNMRERAIKTRIIHLNRLVQSGALSPDEVLSGAADARASGE